MKKSAFILPFGLYVLATTECIRLPSKPFMPDIFQDTMTNYKYQSYHQWPQPMEPRYISLQQQLNNRHFSHIPPLDIGIEFARLFLSSLSNVSNFVIKNHYKTDFNGVTHIYLRQTINDIEVSITYSLIIVTSSLLDIKC